MFCRDCGLPYEEFGVDLVFPDDEWKLICGRDRDTGIVVLCANCIAKRVSRLDDPVGISASLYFEKPDKVLRWFLIRSTDALETLVEYCVNCIDEDALDEVLQLIADSRKKLAAAKEKYEEEN